MSNMQDHGYSIGFLGLVIPKMFALVGSIIVSPTVAVSGDFQAQGKALYKRFG